MASTKGTPSYLRRNVICVHCGVSIDWNAWWNGDCARNTEGHIINPKDIAVISALPQDEEQP